MKNETINDYLRRRLSELKGLHNQISRESGIAQATVSRIYLGEVSPRLETVQPLLDWIDQHDKQSASRIPHARRRVQAGRANRAAATALSE